MYRYSQNFPATYTHGLYSSLSFHHSTPFCWKAIAFRKPGSPMPLPKYIFLLMRYSFLDIGLSNDPNFMEVFQEAL